MSKQQNISQKGKVVKCLPDFRFKVEMDMVSGNECIILAYLAGKLKQHNIQIAIGDEVQVEMSPYDLSKGRIVYRY